MLNPNKLKRNLKMKKSIIILVFVFVLSQLGNAYSTIENVPSITGRTELPKPLAQANTINLEDNVKENKKPVVLLVPVESSEEIYDSHDEEESVEEQTTEEIEDVTHNNHKTKRCKSLRTARRIPVAKDSRKYISASTESSLDESVENPIGGTSLFRVASVKDAKKILKNLLKSHSTKREDDASLERVSKIQKQDSIKSVSKDSDRQGHRPKKYVCYCVEENCDMKRSGKKPSRTYAVKKRIGPNVLGKSSTNYEGQDIRGQGFLHSEEVLKTPNNLHCPPGAILMEEPEYLAKLAMKRQKQNFRHRSTKNCPESIAHPDLEADSLGRPTKIDIPLVGNQKLNRRVYKVNRKSPFAQQLQSVFKQTETQDRISCPEPELTYNDPQGIQNYYNGEQSNYDHYNQIPVAPNLVYPGPYVVYPQFPQYPQYPQYGDGLDNPIPMEPPRQDFVSHEEPSHNQYMPTPLGRNFVDINQCIKLFGRNFCIVKASTVSPIPNPYYANNCRDEHEEPGMVAQWQEDTYDTTKMPQKMTSKYPTSVCNADKPTTYHHGLEVTRHHKEKLPGGKKYSEDDSEQQYGGRISSGREYDRVTTSAYYSEPVNLKIQANDEVSQTANYETIGSKHEELDYGDYEKFVDPESPIRHGHTSSEYLIPIEHSYDTESVDYLSNYEEIDKNNVLQKNLEENVTEGRVMAITKNLQGAHKMSSPKYFQYTVKPVEGISTSYSDNTSDATFEDTSDGNFEPNSEYIQGTQDSRLSDYDRSEFRYSTSKPSNEESVRSFTEFSPGSVLSTIDRPEDDSRTSSMMASQRKNKLPDWQRVTTMNPNFDNEDRKASTSFRVHDSNHQSNVYPSTLLDQAEANFERQTPKMTSSHRQFVGFTQSTPFKYHSEPGFISSTTIGGNNYYASSYEAEDEAEDATTFLVAPNVPQKPTYTSTTYSKMNNAEEIKTDEHNPQEIEGEENSNEEGPKTLHYTTKSRLGDTYNKYFTNKIHSYLQSKQPESDSDSAAAKTTISYEKLKGKPQSTPMDNFAKSGFVSSMTVDGDNQYTSSYATTVDSKYGATSLSRANEPAKPKFYSTIYPNMDAEEIGQDSSGYEETTVKTPSSLYTSQSRNNDEMNRKYITAERIFYPQVGSYQTTLFDSSNQPEQVGDSFEMSKTGSHQPFVESITQSTSWDSFEGEDSDSDEAISYATITNPKYDTIPLLRANEPERNGFTSHLPYPSTVTDKNRPASSWQQVTEEHDDVSTEKIPSTLHYTTNSKMGSMDKNKWTKAGESKNFHRQFVGITKSTPVNDFSQSGESSLATISGKNYYTTSYSTMKETDDSKTSAWREKRPEEDPFWSTIKPRIRGKYQDKIKGSTWTQYYPTQSEMQETSVDQHFTTEKECYPQFVQLHQSTLVDSSTPRDQLGENFETRKTSLRQPFVGKTVNLNELATPEVIMDASTSSATMESSQYETTPLFGETEPHERKFTSYASYPIIEQEEDTSASSSLQYTEDRNKLNSERIPMFQYISHPGITDMDQNKWTKSGKATSSYLQNKGITESTPVDDLSQSDLASSSAIGGNSDYTTSYPTMENPKYDTTPLLGATEPEERDFTSYSSYPTIEQEEDTSASSSLQYTEDRNKFNSERIPMFQYISHSGITDVDQNEWTKSGKATSSYLQNKGITQSTPVDDLSQSDLASSSAIGGNSDYTTSYPTMEKPKYDTTPLLGATEPEERDFTSYSSYPTIEQEEDTSASSSLQYTEGRNKFNSERIPMFQYISHSGITDVDQNKWTKSGKATSSYLQNKGITQSIPVDDLSQSDLASSSAIGGKSDYTTAYPTMENPKHDTTPLLGATEPEERDFTSYSSYPTIEQEKDTSASSSLQYTEGRNKFNSERIPMFQYISHSGITDVDQNEWTKSGKATSSYLQNKGITQSTPVDDLSQSDLASSSAIGGNSDYTTSYPTMENSKYDATPLLSETVTMKNWKFDSTPLLGATEPEERDFTSYSSYPTIEQEEDTSDSSPLQYTEDRNKFNSERIPMFQYISHSGITDMDQNEWTKSGKATSSYLQNKGITQSTPVDDLSQSDLSSSSAIGGSSHNSHTTSYATMEDIDSSTTSVLGPKEPEEEIFRSTTYPTVHDAEQMKTFIPQRPLSQPKNAHDYQNNLGETRWTQYYPTRSKVQDTNLGQHITTEKNVYSQNVKSQQPTNDVSSSTGFNTQQYFTKEENYDPELSTETPEDITVGNNDDQSTNWYYSSAHPNAKSQSAHRQFAASHHSTTAPTFKPDSGIKEQTNGYFTSKAYDDNINPVTGPDSYFEGKGLKNWNDFTSMSSDDFTIGGTNEVKGVKQPTTVDLYIPEKQKWETTKISPGQFTDYEVVGEETPYNGSTMNDEFNQEPNEEHFPTSPKTQITYENTHMLYPGQRCYEDAISTSSVERTGNEEVGKPIYDLISSTPIADAHFFESHSAEPNILKSENKILEIPSRGSLGIDYTASSEKSTFSKERITQPDITNIPFLDQSTTSYEQEGDTLDDMTSPENEADDKALIYDDSTSPHEDYDYTNEYSTLDKSPTTEFPKYQDDVSLQPLRNTLRNELSLNQKVIPSSINYENYMSSEDDLLSRSSESVAAPDSKTPSNLLGFSTTTKSVNYDDYRDCGSTQELQWYPNYIEEQTNPTFDQSEKISSEDQLSPGDRNILKTTVEKVVNDLLFAKSDEPDKDGHISPEVVGAPLRPGLPELPILKNLFSVPEVKNMAIGTVKGLMSEVSGVPQASSLGRLADHLIDSVLDGVINNIPPGPVTTTSSAVVDEHRYENGQWTVVPVTLVPKNDQIGKKSDSKVLSTTKDIVEHKPDDQILSTIKDIVGRPGIGLHGARLPFVQNIIIRAVENTLRNAKQVVNHSVIWDTLNDVIARAEKSLIPSHRTETTVKTTTKSTEETGFKSSGGKTLGGRFKIAPIIAVTEHVFKDGNWVEKQTVLGAKKKNFDSTTSTTSATDNQGRTSPSSYETSAKPKNEYDYTTKAVDYALLGESEEDAQTQEYDSTTDIVGIRKDIQKNIKSLHGNEDGLDNSPIKYYSPNDRILNYKKNHQAPVEVVGSLNSASTEDYPTSTEIVYNESNEKTDNSEKTAQTTRTDDFVGSSQESTACNCAEKTMMKNKEGVASILRGSTEAPDEDDNYSELTSTIYDSVEQEKFNSENYGKGNSLTTLESRKNLGQELVSTESSEFSSTIHHLDVDQDENNDYTTEEYFANENPSVTQELGRNIAEKSQKSSEEVAEETSYITTDGIESISISNTDQNTKNIHNQIPSMPVYVYDEPVGSTQFSKGTLKSDEQIVERAHEEFIGGGNVMTTENIDQTSGEVEAKIMEFNETPTVSDISEKNLEADNHKHNDESNSIYVYGTEIHGTDPQKTTNGDETATQNLHQQFSQFSERHDCSHVTTDPKITSSQENVENLQFPRFQTTENHSDTGNDEQPDENSTEEYMKMENILTTDNSWRNSEDEITTEAAESNESFPYVTSGFLQAGNKNVDNDSPTRVYVNGEQIQETTTQTIPRKHPKIVKNYISAEEATTSSQGLIGAARNRNGRPRLLSLPRDSFNRPREDNLKGYQITSDGASNCMTPKYDPTYFGKISLNGINPGDDSISDLTNTDLFYVGDGVKIPLTIQRMSDGSYALSISDKICENFVKRKCPCCVPREGDIVEERRRSNEAEEYSVETSSNEDYNYGVLEPTERPEFQGISKKRYVRSTSDSDIVVTSATPVKNFVKKYNLTLNLGNHSPTLIRRNDEDAEEIRNTRRKTRLSSFKDTKLRNLYGNNNEIQRDDSEEIENRIIENPNSDAVSKESNSIRKAEYIFDTDTNDLIQSLLHIKNAPEDKRTEIVLNALDGLVNAAQNPDSMDHYIHGDGVQKIPVDDQNPWVESDEYDLNKMENEMARYGYQKDNPILERIRFIKAQQNSHGQYQYQKNMDHRAKGKMNMLKTVLQWLREVFLETNVNNKN